MSENSRLPIFERWAEGHDQTVHTDQGIFASYDLVLAEVVRVARFRPGFTLNLALPNQFVDMGLLQAGDIKGINLGVGRRHCAKVYWQNRFVRAFAEAFPRCAYIDGNVGN